MQVIVKIPMFEALNGSAASVFEYENEAIFPVYVSRFQGNSHANLLLISKVITIIAR